MDYELPIKISHKENVAEPDLQKYAKVVREIWACGLTRKERAILHRAGVTVLITDFVSEENDLNTGAAKEPDLGINFPTIRKAVIFLQIIEEQKEDSVLPEFIKEFWFDPLVVAVHEIYHNMAEILHAVFPDFYKEFLKLSIDIKQGIKTRLPAETRHLDIAIEEHTENEALLYRVESHFEELCYEDKVALLVWVVLNKDFYTKVMGYETKEVVEEMVCDLKSLHVKYGEEVEKIAGPLLDFLQKSISNTRLSEIPEFKKEVKERLFEKWRSEGVINEKLFNKWIKDREKAIPATKKKSLENADFKNTGHIQR